MNNKSYHTTPKIALKNTIFLRKKIQKHTAHDVAHTLGDSGRRYTRQKTAYRTQIERTYFSGIRTRDQMNVAVDVSQDQPRID